MIDQLQLDLGWKLMGSIIYIIKGYCLIISILFLFYLFFFFFFFFFGGGGVHYIPKMQVTERAFFTIIYKLGEIVR